MNITKNTKTTKKAKKTAMPNETAPAKVEAPVAARAAAPAVVKATMPIETKPAAPVSAKLVASVPEKAVTPLGMKAATPFEVKAVAPVVAKQTPPPPQPPQVVLEFVNPAAKKVCVAGSFNNWQPERTPLRLSGNGRWSGDLKVAPGRYEYLFVVDGQWLPDPNARESVQNPFGGRNSVLTVTA